jgi:hypothetical protein
VPEQLPRRSDAASAVLKNYGLDNLTRAVRRARDDVLGRMATFVPPERAAAPGRRAAIDDALAATTRGEAMSPDDTTTATARDDRTGTPDAVEQREVPETIVVRATCVPRRIVARVRPRPSDSAIEHAYLPVSVLVGPDADDPHWTWLRASAEALCEFAGRATEAQDADALQMAAVELDCMHDAIRDALRPAHPASASANRRDLKPTRSTLTREQKRLARDRAAQLALRRAAMDIDTALAELDALPDDNRPAGIHEETLRLRRRLRTLERAVLADMRKTDDSAREVSSPRPRT